MSKPTLPYTVTVHLSSRIIKQAETTLFRQRHPWFSLLWLVAVTGIGLALVMSVFGMGSVNDLAEDIKAAQMHIAAILAQPEVAAGMRAPGLRKLADVTTEMTRHDFGAIAAKANWLVQRGAFLPAFVLLGLFYLNRKSTRQSEHTLKVRLATEGMGIQRGATHTLHGWDAVKAVTFKESTMNKGGFLIVEMEYGYHHVWPREAFEDHDAFMATGRRLSALFSAPPVAL